MTSSNFPSLIDALYRLERRGIKLGLEHTSALLKSIENPHNELKFIHVAGTNGKGSTCAMIANILRSKGKNVGLFTSPHLVRFNERIRVNGNPISDDKIIHFMEKANPHIEKIESTFFEATTAMAFDYFRNQKVDIAIIETGLGGRLDSTNVINPHLTVITPISMDHMDILGQDLNTIAKEKAGIIKKNVPLVISNQLPSVQKILVENAQGKNASIISLGSVLNIVVNEQGTTFRYKEKNYFTSLIGKHQALNAALAIEAVTRFTSDVNVDFLQQGLKSVFWPGRIQKIGTRLFYDVAHNEDGLEILLNTIQSIYPGKRMVGLFCLKGDKEFDRIVHKINGRFSQLYVTNDETELLLDKNELSQRLMNYGIKNQTTISVSDGFNKIRSDVNRGNVGLIFGSHYIANEVFRASEISFDKGII